MSHFTITLMYRLSEWLRREWLMLMLGGALIVLSLNCVWAPHGIKDLMLLRFHRLRLERVREQERRENRDLRTTIERLQSDDAYLQRQIRHELGFARSNELIYRFGADSPPSSVAP